MVIGKQQIPFLDLWRFISHLQRLRALRYLISGSKESFSSEIVPRAYLMIASVVALQDSLHLANTGSAASLDLEEAIMVCGKTFATDPRDNIYGIYGMFSDDLDEEQKPDYNATPEDVYVKTTKYLMLKNNSLRCCVILEYALPEGLMFHPGFPITIVSVLFCLVMLRKYAERGKTIMALVRMKPNFVLKRHSQSPEHPPVPVVCSAQLQEP